MRLSISDNARAVKRKPDILSSVHPCIARAMMKFLLFYLSCYLYKSSETLFLKCRKISSLRSSWIFFALFRNYFLTPRYAQRYITYALYSNMFNATL